jgi:hypothetical protein
MRIVAIIKRNGNEKNKGSFPWRNNLALHHHNPPAFHQIAAKVSLSRDNKTGNEL